MLVQGQTSRAPSNRPIPEPPVAGSDPRVSVREPLLPARAGNERNWTSQEVEIVALTDEHLVAASTPVSLDSAGLGRVDLLKGGVLRHRSAAAWAALHRRELRATAEAAELAAIRARYPSATRDYLEIGRTTRATLRHCRAPRDGGGAVRATSATCRSGRTRGSTGRPSGSPPAHAGRTAPSSRSRRGCARQAASSYDEQPPSSGGVPPLAYFVDEGRRGYCQHFAGAMALMLRFLGVPTRIAAGFTSGRRRDGVWTVTDRNAHTWVEVWFPRLRLAPVRPDAGSRSDQRRPTAPRPMRSTRATRPTVPSAPV